MKIKGIFESRVTLKMGTLNKIIAHICVPNDSNFETISSKHNFEASSTFDTTIKFCNPHFSPK